MRKTLLAFSFASCSSIFCLPAPIDLSIDDLDVNYVVNPDYTYTVTTTETDTYHTDKAVQENKYARQTFDPDTQKLKVLEAKVIQANGQVINIPKSSMFVRPAPITEEAPQFTNQQVMSIVLPQLVPGSKTQIKWQLTRTKPSPFGFNFYSAAPFNIAIKNATMSITTPSNMPLRYISRGPIKVTKKIGDKTNILTAVIKNQKPQLSETDMAAPSYFETFISATTLKDWSEYGNIWNKLLKDKAVVTDQIEDLAEELTKGQKPEAAKASLYNFVVQKISSLPVDIHSLSYDKIPTAEQVLKTGYADPRGKAILLSALYKAIGVKNQIAVTSADGQTDYPQPVVAAMNDMVVYLPEKEQYADSSAKYQSFNVLSSGISDQLTVILSDNSQTNKTPANKPADNRYVDSANLLLTPSGSFNGKDRMAFFGNLNGLARAVLDTNLDPNVKFNAMLASTDTGGKGSIKFTNPKDLNINMVITGNWQSPSVVELGKEALFTLPDGYNNFPPSEFRSAIPEPNRSFPLQLGAKTLRWQNALQIPPGYKIATVPKGISIDNKVGTYSSRYQKRGDALMATRTLVFKQKLYPPSDYLDLQALITGMLQDVETVIKLKKV